MPARLVTPDSGPSHYPWLLIDCRSPGASGAPDRLWVGPVGSPELSSRLPKPGCETRQWGEFGGDETALTVYLSLADAYKYAAYDGLGARDRWLTGQGGRSGY